MGNKTNKISLVIPCKNEAGSLPGLIKSIQDQTRKPDEVIFVDTGSTDNSQVIIRVNRFRLIETSASIGNARNIGVENATGNLIAFTDCGIILDKNWLYELEKSHSLFDRKCVFGTYEPIIDNYIQEMSLYAYIEPEDPTKSHMRTNFIASSLFDRSVFDSVKFPDLNAGEDRIFIKMIKNTFEGELEYCLKAKVKWSIPHTAREILRRFIRLSYYDIEAGLISWHKRVIIYFFIMLFFTMKGLWYIAIILYIIRTLKKILSNYTMPFGNALKIKNFLVILYLIFITDIACLIGIKRRLCK